MGLSFHYKGALKKSQLLKPMVEEVVDIAKANQWPHHVFEEHFPDNSFTSNSANNTLYGISFTPPKCETVCLTFLADGKMGSFFDLNQPLSEKENEDRYVFVKTQFAGPKVHILLINLFDYLSKKYFENFDMYDEGNYWETKNEQLLEETFAKYTNLIEGFDSLLSTIPMEENETMEGYLLRIAEMNRKKNEGNDNGNNQ
jgi:hypothetical protein